MPHNILVGIHRAIHDKIDSELEVYKNILKYNNIPFIDLDSSELDFWDKVKHITHFIYKWSHAHSDHQIANALIPIIQYHLKKKCFPNWETSWHYDDKIKQYYLLKENGFPVCDSYIFYHKSSALKFIKNADFPIVFKLKNGAGSLNVKLVKNAKEAIGLINKMFGDGIYQSDVSLLDLFKTYNYNFKKIYRHYLINLRNKYLQKHKRTIWKKHKNYIYFQKFLKNNKWDTRVTTAGLRAHAFRRFNRPNDFRASGSNLWDLDKDKIDLRMVKIALNITKHFGFQSMAYDFLLDEKNEPKIIEISYLYGGAGYPDFMNGYWDEDLNWHEGRYWPQYFELCDLLEMSYLKLPDNIHFKSDYSKVTIK